LCDRIDSKRWLTGSQVGLWPPWARQSSTLPAGATFCSALALMLLEVAGFPQRIVSSPRALTMVSAGAMRCKLAPGKLATLSHLTFLNVSMPRFSFVEIRSTRAACFRPTGRKGIKYGCHAA
jgi:hypothetical protein